MTLPIFTVHEYFAAYEPHVLDSLPHDADLTPDTQRAEHLARDAGLDVSPEGRYPAIVWFAAFP